MRTINILVAFLFFLGFINANAFATNLYVISPIEYQLKQDGSNFVFVAGGAKISFVQSICNTKIIDRIKNKLNMIETGDYQSENVQPVDSYLSKVSFSLGTITRTVSSQSKIGSILLALPDDLLGMKLEENYLCDKR